MPILTYFLFTRTLYLVYILNGNLRFTATRHMVASTDADIGTKRLSNRIQIKLQQWVESLGGYECLSIITIRPFHLIKHCSMNHTAFCSGVVAQYVMFSVEECRLLGYKNPVRTSQETHYVSATETSQLILCKMRRIHGNDYEECRLLGC
jgi:hypothetical protein